MTCEPQGLATLLRFGWRKGHFMIANSLLRWDTITETLRGGSTYDFIAWDTITSYYYDLLLAEKAKETGKPLSELGFKIWGLCKELFEDWFRKALSLQEQGVINVFLAHQKWREDSGVDEKIQMAEMDLPGQLPGFVSKHVSTVLRCVRVKDDFLFTCSGRGEDTGKDVYGLCSVPRENCVKALIDDLQKARELLNMDKGEAPTEKDSSKSSFLDSSRVKPNASPSLIEIPWEKVLVAVKDTRVPIGVLKLFVREEMGINDPTKLTAEQADKVIKKLAKLKADTREPWIEEKPGKKKGGKK